MFHPSSELFCWLPKQTCIECKKQQLQVSNCLSSVWSSSCVLSIKTALLLFWLQNSIIHIIIYAFHTIWTLLFSHAAPSDWDCMPHEIRHIQSVHLKPLSRPVCLKPTTADNSPPHPHPHPRVICVCTYIITFGHVCNVGCAC